MRPLKHRFHCVRGRRAERPRRGPRGLVARREAELEEVLAVERRASRHALDHDQREGEHVGPGAGRSVRARELLGRRVGGRERRRHPRRPREGAACRLHVLHDLRDAEVEQLDRAVVGSRVAEDEDVRRLDVSVGDAPRVGERERLCDGLEQPNAVVEASAAPASPRPPLRGRPRVRTLRATRAPCTGRTSRWA